MTTSALIRPLKKQQTKLSSQLETVLEELVRLSSYVHQLSELTDEQLETLDIANQVDAIHLCLNRFESRFMAIKIPFYGDEFAEPMMKESELVYQQSTGDWNTVQREAKRANKLASQLTTSLNKIRAGLGEVQDPGSVPVDIVRISQAVRNTVCDLEPDCLLDHG